MEETMWWLMASVPLATFAILIAAWHAPLTAIDFECSRLDISLDAVRDEAGGSSRWARRFVGVPSNSGSYSR